MDSVSFLKRIWRPISRNIRPINRLIRKWKISRVSQASLCEEQKLRFEKLGLNWEIARIKVEELFRANKDISPHRSEHYELFAAISKHESPSRILEIGTAEGDFSVFLATIFPDSMIETIDLPSSESRFWNATTDLSVQDSLGVPASDISLRDNKLSKFKNIKFREMNSLGLTFQEDQKYDIIWVDGDHTYPVVAVDIANALRLLKVGGVLGFDDIYVTRQENNGWGGQESFEMLTQFQNAGLIKFELILKKLFPKQNLSKKDQKFIAVARRSN